MANRNPASFAKRQREAAKRAKRQEKAEKRAKRRADRVAPDGSELPRDGEQETPSPPEEAPSVGAHAHAGPAGSPDR